MPVKELEKREETSLFKIFLRRIWFKNHADYMNLFGNDVEKRNEAVRRFRKTYPNFKLNN